MIVEIYFLQGVIFMCPQTCSKQKFQHHHLAQCRFVIEWISLSSNQLVLTPNFRYSWLTSSDTFQVESPYWISFIIQPMDPLTALFFLPCFLSIWLCNNLVQVALFVEGFNGAISSTICYLQKHLDDSAFVYCISDGKETWLFFKRFTKTKLAWCPNSDKALMGFTSLAGSNLHILIFF